MKNEISISLTPIIIGFEVNVSLIIDEKNYGVEIQISWLDIYSLIENLNSLSY